MPVVTIYFNRLQNMLKQKISKDEIVERLPYLALDIEEVQNEFVKVEYNPNRPDFSTDYGIARALNGLLGFEVGLPKYETKKSNYKLVVEKSVKEVRPCISALVAKNIVLDDETIRQLIAMQEDLHQGIGRQRRKVSIGLHNLDVLYPPMIYKAEEPSFKFLPLNEVKEMSMEEILKKTEVGIKYGHIISSYDRYPLLIDSKGQVLSFPPIVNGELTRVTNLTRNLFIDVTGTEQKAVDDALAILSCALSDAGAELYSVEIVDEEKNTKRITPNLTPYEMNVDVELTKKLLGLNLSKDDIVKCLRRSRIDVKVKDNEILAKIPRYRIDVLHPVDLVEDVMIGYGVDQITPTLPSSNLIGIKDERLRRLEVVREVLIGFQLIEVTNFSLVSEELLNNAILRNNEDLISVESPKSLEHSILRDLLLPSLLSVLSLNVKEDYPQRIFEIGKVFIKDEYLDLPVREEYHACVAIAHAKASFTEAKSILCSFISQLLNQDCKTIASDIPMMIKGRGAKITWNGKEIGFIGEISPEVLEKFKVKVPVAMFEINLEPFLI
jgi:phenylalanyl-tRNA synthetase beta chain